MRDRSGLERELSLLREYDGRAAEPEREATMPASQADGLFAEMEKRARQNASLSALIAGVTVRVVLQRDRAIVRGPDDPRTLVYPLQLTNSRAGVYYVEWNANCNLRRIIDVADGKPATKKEWSDAVLAGETQLRAQRCQRKGLVWVTQTIGKTSEGPDPEEFPLYNYPTLSDEAARAFRDEHADRPLIVVGETRSDRPPPSGAATVAGGARPAGGKPNVTQAAQNAQPPVAGRQLVITGITGGIFESGKREGKPLNFTYWTHDGAHALVSRGYLCRGANASQCQDFWFLVPIQDIADFLRFWPITSAGRSALGMVMLWQIVMEIGVYFIPVIGPIWGLVQTTRGAVDAYHNWDKMSGWEKALVGVDVLLTAVPGGKGVFKGVKGIKSVEEGTEALVRAGLTKGEARRLMVGASVLQQEKKAVEAVAKLGEMLRKGGRLGLDELLEVERTYNTLMKGLSKTERALEEARAATHNLEAARDFLKDAALSETHLAGMRRLTPEMLVDLRALSKTQSSTVLHVLHAAGESPQAAWGLMNLRGAVRQDHLLHIATWLGDDVVAQIGSGSVTISDSLAKLVKAEGNLDKAYQLLMRGGVVGRAKTKVAGLSEALQKSRPQALPKELAALEQKFAHVYLTERQLVGLSRLDASVQDLLAKEGVHDLALHRAASTAARSTEAAAALDKLGLRLAAVKTRSKRLSVGSVLGRLDPGFVELVATARVELPDELIAAAAGKVGAYDAVKLMMTGMTRGLGRGRQRFAGYYERLSDELSAIPYPLRALDRIGDRPLAGNLFAKWAMKSVETDRKVVLQHVKGVDVAIALGKSKAEEVLVGIYTGFPGNHVGIFDAIGRLQNAKKARNVDKLLKDLAAGSIIKEGELTAQGASLVLAYAMRHMPDAPAIEHGFSRLHPYVNRVHDMYMGPVKFEMKLWNRFSGEPVRRAEQEFAKDLVISIGEGDLTFRNLRWVFTENMHPYRPAIVEMMTNVLTKNADVAKALKLKKIDPGKALDDLRHALDPDRGWLLEFFTPRP